MNREQSHIWDKQGDKDELRLHKNLLSIVTMTNGCNEDSTKYILSKEFSWLPTEINLNYELYQVMTGYSNNETSLELVHLMPDILGEYFVLENLKKDMKFKFKDIDRPELIVKTAWEIDKFNVWFFVMRAIEDFTSHVSIPLLLNIPDKSDKAAIIMIHKNIGIMIFNLMERKLKMKDEKALNILFLSIKNLHNSVQGEDYYLLDLTLSYSEACMKMIRFYGLFNNFVKQKEFYQIMKDSSDKLIKESNSLVIDHNKFLNDFIQAKNQGELDELKAGIMSYVKKYTEFFAIEAGILSYFISILFLNSPKKNKGQILKYFERLKYFYVEYQDDIRIKVEYMKALLYYEALTYPDSDSTKMLIQVTKDLNLIFKELIDIGEKNVYKYDKSRIYVWGAYQVIQSLLSIDAYREYEIFYNDLFDRIVKKDSLEGFVALAEMTSRVMIQLYEKKAVVYADPLQKRIEYLMDIKPAAYTPKVSQVHAAAILHEQKIKMGFPDSFIINIEDDF